MKKHIITGLVILLPVALTIAIIGFIVNFLTRPFLGIVSHFLAKTAFATRGFFIFSPEHALVLTSQIIILICLFLVIWIVGMIARWYLVHLILHYSEKLLHKLPLVNKIYKATKEIITSLLGQGETSFQHVVLVPFPEPGKYALGFLSKPAPSICSDAASHVLISVFIPTCPNPTTGFTVMYKPEEIHKLDMSPEEAIKYIVSCGMISPHDQPHSQGRKK